jgi:BetR domain
MEPPDLQQQFFNHLKSVLPAHLSLVDEVSGLLNLSPDSAYRRMRGEKPITLPELKKLCEHYKISLDQILQLRNESVLFDAPGMNGETGEFVDYLKAMLAQFKYFNSFKKKEIQYLCKDAPIWYFYLFPEIAAFKTFFWSKTINNHPKLAGKLFSLKEYLYEDCFTVGQQVLQEYNEIHSIELWNLESIHSSINQLAYYKDAGNFKTCDDFVAVVHSFHKMLDHLQLQAEKGVKFMPGAPVPAYKAPIQFYINELILGNNTMLLSLDDKRMTMLSYSIFNYLFTKDERFSTKTLATFNTLLSRAALVSGTGEKDRNKFFNILREKANSLLK